MEVVDSLDILIHQSTIVIVKVDPTTQHECIEGLKVRRELSGFHSLNFHPHIELLNSIPQISINSLPIFFILAKASGISIFLRLAKAYVYPNHRSEQSDYGD